MNLRTSKRDIWYVILYFTLFLEFVIIVAYAMTRLPLSHKPIETFLIIIPNIFIWSVIYGVINHSILRFRIDHRFLFFVELLLVLTLFIYTFTYLAIFHQCHPYY